MAYNYLMALFIYFLIVALKMMLYGFSRFYAVFMQLMGRIFLIISIFIILINQEVIIIFCFVIIMLISIPYFILKVACFLYGSIILFIKMIYVD